MRSSATSSPARCSSEAQTGSSEGPIGRLLAPRSVAVVGASPDSRGPGTKVLENLGRAPNPPRLFAVNNRHAGQDGFYPDVTSLPETPDLVCLAVPARHVNAIVAEAARRGVSTFMVLSSGFAEAGPEGRALEAGLRSLAGERQLTILGPNSLGLFNFATGAHLSFGTALDEITAGDPETCRAAGRAALIVQSGAIGSYLVGMARPRLPFRYMVSTGNETALAAADLVAHFALAPDIDVIALYVEGVVDGRRLIDAIALAGRRGKHVVLLPAGESPVSARAAASHTAALASSNALTRTLAADAGAYLVNTPEELLGAVSVLLAYGEPTVPGIGVISVSGGVGVILADRLSQAGLPVPEPAPATIERLRAALPDYVVPGNPTDATAGSIFTPEVLADALRGLADDPQVGQLIVAVGAGGEHAPRIASALSQAGATLGKPSQLVWLACPESTRPALAAGPTPVSPSIANAVSVARALVRQQPAAAHEPADNDQLTPVDAAAVTEALSSLLPEPGGLLSERDSRRLLRAAGLPVGEEAFITLADADHGSYAACPPFPVAVKLQARGIHHKTEIGGVVLDVPDAAALSRAIADTAAAAKVHVPDAVIDGWIVESMAPRGVEVLVTARHDPSYGCVLVAGSGGVATELVKDVQAVPGPATPGQSSALLRRTRVGQILNGFRGRTTDLSSLSAVMSRLSAIVALLPAIREIECNPVIVSATGTVTVVDALVQLSPPAAAGSPQKAHR